MAEGVAAGSCAVVSVCGGMAELLLAEAAPLADPPGTPPVRTCKMSMVDTSYAMSHARCQRSLA